MYSQANVRAGKVLRPLIRALPSVIVDTEKVLREADGCVELVVVRPHADGKVFVPGCASKTGLLEPVRSPKNTSVFDRIKLDPKIQIKYIDTKNQLADILTKGNFTRDEWNHLLSLFNISHFSSTVCSEAMAKRLQQDSGEERVTAKSRPMMSLIARVPSNVSSSTSVSPGEEKLWKSKSLECES